MGVLTRLFERRASAGQAFHVSQTPPGWVESLGGWDTAIGRSVSPDSALQATAVYACVRILAETIASLPLPVYRRLPDGGKVRAPEHYLYPILHDLPNPEMTSFELRETLMGHVATWGNAYAEIELSRSGKVLALWPLRPDRMTVKRDEAGQLVYVYRLSPGARSGDLRPATSSPSTEVALAAERVLHVRGLGYNGLVGYSPIAMARQAVALSLATEEFGARFFGNGARPGMVLKHPGKLSNEAHKRLQESWEERHQGLDKAHRTAILEEGLDVQEIGLPPNEAQFLETRKYQVTDIARLYRIPPHMLADLERATFSNIEHQSLEFVIHTIRPWLVRWEQAIGRSLFLPSERGQFFAEFLVDGLLRGDIQSRYQAYATARQNGWLSANDVRRLENMNPIDGGDVYLVPLNMVPAPMAGAGLGSAEGDLRSFSVSSPPDGSDGRSLSAGSDLGETGDGRQKTGGMGREVRSGMMRHRLEQVHRPLYQEVLARVLRRERNDVGGAIQKYLRSKGFGQETSPSRDIKGFGQETSPDRSKRSEAQFDLWLREFYEEHGRWAFDQLAPVARAYGELVAGAAQEEVGAPEGYSEELEVFEHAYLAAWSGRHTNVSEARIREILRQAQNDNIDPEEALLAELEMWPEQRAAEEAWWESVRFGGAVALTVYALAGRTTKRWMAFGKSCPYCTDLHGRTVGITEFFLPAGMEFLPAGAQQPLVTSWDTGHPPAHKGCDCMVVAG